MKQIKHEALLEFSAEQIYQLVNDVAAYPQFLPWCAASEVLTETAEAMTASLTIQKGNIKKCFTTENSLLPFSSITLNLTNGPFKHMQGLWQFTALADDACKVSFTLDIAFNSKLLAMTLAPLFTNIANTMIDAFRERAQQIYLK